MKPEELTNALKQALGDGLKSVVLYGSAAAGDYVRKRSDYNVLVVVESLGTPELRAVSTPTRKWVKVGNPAPLFFTLDRLRASTDTFPIELTDIRQTHTVLYGQDVVSDLTIHPEHLRLELESELKGKLIQLRERYITAAEHPREVRELFIRSLSTFLVLCRAALRLWQPDVPPKKLDAARALAKHIGFDVGVFERITTLKETGRLSNDPHQVFADYLKAVETIVDAVDAHVKQPVAPPAPGIPTTPSAPGGYEGRTP